MNKDIEICDGIKADDANADTDSQVVCRYTGLSESTVKHLRELDTTSIEIIDKLIHSDLVDRIIHYLGCVVRVKEFNEECKRLEIDIQKSPEPELDKDPAMQALLERALNGDETAEIEYRDWLYNQNEKAFKEIEDTDEYRENDLKLTELCKRYGEIHEEIDEAQRECKGAWQYVQNGFAENIKQIAEGGC